MGKAAPDGRGLTRFAEVVEQYIIEGESRSIERVHAVLGASLMTEQELYAGLWKIVADKDLPPGSYQFQVGVRGVF